MKCKACQYPDSHVVHTYQNDHKSAVERRRECKRCGNRFTTYERLKEPKNHVFNEPTRMVK